MKTHPLLAIPLLTFVFALDSHAALSVILHAHTGDAVPATEGWSSTASTGTVVGPVLDGVTPAWSIANTVAGDYAFYPVVPPASEVSAAAAGWSLETTLRVTDVDLAPGGSMLTLYRDGIRSYQMHFGSASNGDAIVTLADNTGGFDSTFGASYTVPGGTGYNTFELLYSPGEGSADLFVNGVERLSDYEGFDLPLAQGLVAWGDGSTRDLSPRMNTSSANYSSVIFSIVPEPSAALLALSVAMLGCLRRTARGQENFVPISENFPPGNRE